MLEKVTVLSVFSFLFLGSIHVLDSELIWINIAISQVSDGAWVALQAT